MCFGETALTVDTDNPPPGVIARVEFPVLMQLGQPTPDGRMFNPAGFTHRDLPLPLLYKNRTTHTPGHDQAVVVGSVQHVEIDGNTVRGWGYLADIDGGREALAAIQSQSIRGVSADLTDATAEQPGEGHLTIWPNLNRYYTQARLAALTIVPIPAFPDAHVNITDTYPTLTAAATITPHRPPRDWFTNPNLPQPTPLTVTSDGRIYGHVALTDTCHTGLNGCTRIPRDDNFAEYLSHGTVICDNDEAVPVGQIFVGGPHADGNLTGEQAAAYYADSTYTWGDVTVGYDNHGIWCAGAARPDIGETLLYHARASALSGDWRPAKNGARRGRLTLKAILSVNSPGFPIVDNNHITASGPPPGHTMTTDTDEPDGTAELAIPVGGYRRKDGTLVRAYQRRGTRTAPGRTEREPRPLPTRDAGRKPRVTAADINKAFNPLPTNPPQLAKWARDSRNAYQAIVAYLNTLPDDPAKATPQQIATANSLINTARAAIDIKNVDIASTGLAQHYTQRVNQRLAPLTARLTAYLAAGVNRRTRRERR